MVKLLSILIAFQVLLSSLSFNLDLHFCGDQLKGVSLFEHAATCHEGDMDMDKDEVCSMPTPMQMAPSDCCQNHQLIVEGQDIQTPQAKTSDLLAHTQFAVALVASFINVFFPQDAPRTEYLNFKPPLAATDIPVWVQSFLI